MDTDIIVSVKDKILKPIDQVFDAVVNPDKISGFFISRTSGPLKGGDIVTWFFDDVGMSLPVSVITVQEYDLIALEWSASGLKTRVDMLFIPIDAQTTSVTITEKSFPFDKDNVLKALQQTQGWTDFICSMKAYLHCGINLRSGRTKGSY